MTHRPGEWEAEPFQRAQLAVPWWRAGQEEPPAEQVVWTLPVLDASGSGRGMAQGLRLRRCSISMFIAARRPPPAAASTTTGVVPQLAMIKVFPAGYAAYANHEFATSAEVLLVDRHCCGEDAQRNQSAVHSVEGMTQDRQWLILASPAPDFPFIPSARPCGGMTWTDFVPPIGRPPSDVAARSPQDQLHPPWDALVRRLQLKLMLLRVHSLTEAVIRWQRIRRQLLSGDASAWTHGFVNPLTITAEVDEALEAQCAAAVASSVEIEDDDARDRAAAASFSLSGEPFVCLSAPPHSATTLCPTRELYQAAQGNATSPFIIDTTARGVVDVSVTPYRPPELPPMLAPSDLDELIRGSTGDAARDEEEACRLRLAAAVDRLPDVTSGRYDCDGAIALADTYSIGSLLCVQLGVVSADFGECEKRKMQRDDAVPPTCCAAHQRTASSALELAARYWDVVRQGNVGGQDKWCPNGDRPVAAPSRDPFCTDPSNQPNDDGHWTVQLISLCRDCVHLSPASRPSLAWVRAQLARLLQSVLLEEPPSTTMSYPPWLQPKAARIDDALRTVVAAAERSNLLPPGHLVSYSYLPREAPAFHPAEDHLIQSFVAEASTYLAAAADVIFDPDAAAADGGASPRPTVESVLPAETSPNRRTLPRPSPHAVLTIANALESETTECHAMAYIKERIVAAGCALVRAAWRRGLGKTRRGDEDRADELRRFHASCERFLRVLHYFQFIESRYVDTPPPSGSTSPFHVTTRVIRFVARLMFGVGEEDATAACAAVRPSSSQGMPECVCSPRDNLRIAVDSLKRNWTLICNHYGHRRDERFSRGGATSVLENTVQRAKVRVRGSAWMLSRLVGRGSGSPLSLSLPLNLSDSLVPMKQRLKQVASIAELTSSCVNTAPVQGAHAPAGTPPSTSEISFRMVFGSHMGGMFREVMPDVRALLDRFSRSPADVRAVSQEFAHRAMCVERAFAMGSPPLRGGAISTWLPTLLPRAADVAALAAMLWHQCATSPRSSAEAIRRQLHGGREAWWEALSDATGDGVKGEDDFATRVALPHHRNRVLMDHLGGLPASPCRQHGTAAWCFAELTALLAFMSHLCLAASDAPACRSWIDDVYLPAVAAAYVTPLYTSIMESHRRVVRSGGKPTDVSLADAELVVALMMASAFTTTLSSALFLSRGSGAAAFDDDQGPSPFSVIKNSLVHGLRRVLKDAFYAALAAHPMLLVDDSTGASSPQRPTVALRVEDAAASYVHLCLLDGLASVAETSPQHLGQDVVSQFERPWASDVGVASAAKGTPASPSYDDEVTRFDNDGLIAISQAAAFVSMMLPEKDRFCRCHREAMSRRLLGDESSSASSSSLRFDTYVDRERHFLSGLSKRLGRPFVATLDHMLSDVVAASAGSNDVAAASADAECPTGDAAGSHHRAAGAVATPRMRPVVLTSSHWASLFPERVVSLGAAFSLHSMLASQLLAFEQRHRSVHPQRRLTWIPLAHLGSSAHCEVMGLTCGSRTVVGSLLFATLLLHVGQSAEGHSTTAQLARSVNLDPALVQKHLDILVAKKVLSPYTRSAPPVDGTHDAAAVCEEREAVGYTVEMCASMHRPRPLLLPRLRVGGGELGSSGTAGGGLSQDRHAAVDACIVRLLKSRRRIAVKELFESVIQQLGHIFTPDAAMIKRQMEALMERDFFVRDAHDGTFLVYTA